MFSLFLSAHAYNLSTWEVVAEESGVLVYSWLNKLEARLGYIRLGLHKQNRDVKLINLIKH